MIRGAFESAGELDPSELREAYDEVLAEAIESVGVAEATEQTDVDSGTVQAIVDGESPELSLEDAAILLALDPDRPDAESIAVEARDILLMGMSAAVLDVEALASGIDDALEPKSIQGKIEGRYPMTLDEYALVHGHIESRKR